jgi:photosystem II stability/assembly factor-like uncharacterized protein
LRRRLHLLIFLLVALVGKTQAQTWERLGPEGGLVISLGSNSGGTLFLGTADGHVFVKESGAAKWELRGRVGTRTDGVITRLLTLPGDATNVYAAVWYQQPQAGGGVFRSEDGARTWKLIGLQGEAVRALEAAPSRPDEFIAGTRTGIFRSQDAGKNWQRISPAGDEEIRNLDSVAVDPKDPNTIYAGTYHLPWKTVDGGKSWKPVTAGLIDDSDIMSLRVDATDPARIYLSACSGIYRSENHGEAWTKLQGIPYAARRTQAILQDPQAAKTLYAATTEGLWVTSDGGESWKLTSPQAWVVNAAVVLPNASGKHSLLVIGTESQGILVSNDGAQNFTPANQGFSHTVVKQLVGAWEKPNHLAMVLERNGQEILQSQDAGATWTPFHILIAAGKGKDKELSPAEVSQLYGSPWGWLLRSHDGRLWAQQDGRDRWAEWKLLLPPAKRTLGPTARAAGAITKATAIRVDNGPIAFETNNLWATVQGSIVRCVPGASCVRLPAFEHVTGVTALMVVNGGTTIYVAAGSKLGTLMDSGKTAVWRDLPATVLNVNNIFAVQRQRSILLATDRGLFSSSDEGSSWQRLGSGLPAGNVEEFLRAAGLFVATLGDGGVYVSRDQGGTWQRVDRDAERGHLTGLAEVEPGKVIAGSQSEGLLRLTLAP